MIRLFLALPLPLSVMDSVAGLRRELARRLPASGLKWVPPRQYHVTLKFLGDVEETEVPNVQRALRIACAEFPPLRLSAAGLGVFPTPRHPKVLWMGIDGDVPALTTLQGRLEGAMEPWAPRENRPYAAHLTLARVKFSDRSWPRAWRTLPNTLTTFRAGGWRNETVVLMRSDLGPEGADYTTLFQATLQGVDAS